MSDIQKFQQIAFQHVIFDEAHRIKSSKSKIALTLKMLPCPRILLLTGTPIQNNTIELFGLLNII
jgi:SNF2 family DNA or RNA helicase